MGLDMYIEIIQDSEEEEELDPVLYWRKQPALHEWFHQLALDKKIEFDDFNCVPVPLTKEDIFKLQQDLNNRTLDFGAKGFFFGSNDSMSEEEIKDWCHDRLQDCNKLLKSIEAGNQIQYNSWW